MRTLYTRTRLYMETDVSCDHCQKVIKAQSLATVAFACFRPGKNETGAQRIVRTERAMIRYVQYAVYCDNKCMNEAETSKVARREVRQLTREAGTK